MIRLFAFLQLFALAFFVLLAPAFSQYSSTKHRQPVGNEVPVHAAGSYARPGTTYVLMNDISAKASTIFLGKDITFDLNGYTIKYASANYQHVMNSGFEEGDKGWDLSKAPGAK